MEDIGEDALTMSLVNTQGCVWRSCCDLESCCYTSSCDILCPVWRVFILTQNRTCRHLFARHTNTTCHPTALSSLPALLQGRKLLSIRSHQLVEHTNDGGRINKTSSDRVFGMCLDLWANSVVVSKLALGSRRSWAANGSWLQLPSCSFTAHGNSVTNSRSVLNEVECSMTFVVV